MIYKLGIIVLVAAALGGLSVSVLFMAGSSVTPNHVITTNSVASTTNSMVNVTGTTITQDAGSLTPNGCGNLVKNETSQGYEVATYVSSSSVTTGDYLCIDVVLLNLNGTQLTEATGSALVASYNVTSSSGLVVFRNSCTPSTPVADSSDALSRPLRDLTCSGAWNVSAPVDGTTPAPGTYEISVIASVPNANGTGKASVAYSTPVTLSTAQG
jgi:hypothetical protein